MTALRILRALQLALQRAIIVLVRGYQLAIAPWLRPSCRFLPSCSAYMVEAVQTHGALRGAFLGIRRVCRCHPFTKSGFDPVPPR